MLKEPVRIWKLLFVPVMFASIVVIAKPPAFWNIIDPPPAPHPKVSQNSKLSILKQGQLQRWTEHSTLIFENLKLVEKSKNHFSII